jgi:hypothetical protein
VAYRCNGLIDEATAPRSIAMIHARATSPAVIEGRFDHIDHHFRSSGPTARCGPSSRWVTTSTPRMGGAWWHQLDVTDRERSGRRSTSRRRTSRAKGELLSRAAMNCAHR